MAIDDLIRMCDRGSSALRSFQADGVAPEYDPDERAWFIVSEGAVACYVLATGSPDDDWTELLEQWVLLCAIADAGYLFNYDVTDDSPRVWRSITFYDEDSGDLILKITTPPNLSAALHLAVNELSIPWTVAFGEREMPEA